MLCQQQRDGYTSWSKVSVHLTITVQTSGTQRLLDHSICRHSILKRPHNYLEREQWPTEGEGLGGQPPSKFRSFSKAEPNSRVRGKYICNCLVFLFHHPN
jgi:hypothetical protein